MVKVKNISEFTQAVSGIPKFAPGEEKDVSAEVADLLSNNDNFVVVNNKKKINSDNATEEKAQPKKRGAQ